MTALAFLDAVTPILSQPDVTFGNLEGVLQDGGEPVKQCKDKTHLLPVPHADALRRVLASSRASTC